MALLETLIVVSGLLLCLTILLQHRASGLSATFGGGGATYVQRRGAERFIFQASVWLSVLFFGFSLAYLLLPKYL